MISHAVLLFLKVLPHYGEPAIRTGRIRHDNGYPEIEVRMVHCVHPFETEDRTVWIKREDI